MAEGGAFIRGFGYQVEKETPRQLLGELEVERDAEREEERLEAEARDAEDQERRERADVRAEGMDTVLSQFQEELYPSNDGYDSYDDVPPEPISPDEIVRLVRAYAEDAREKELDEAIPQIGTQAMYYVLNARDDKREEFLDFRVPLRALNEIAHICRMHALPETSSGGYGGWNRTISPLAERLRDDLDQPFAAYARANQSVPVDEDRARSPLFSDRDIDTLAARVSRVALLRQTLAGVPLSEQRRVIDEMVSRCLIPPVGGGGFGGDRGIDVGAIRKLQIIRRAFPFAKGDILARGKTVRAVSHALDADAFSRNPADVLADFSLARQFDKECGLNIDRKNDVLRLLAELADIPTYDPDGIDERKTEFERRMDSVRALVGKAWDVLPKGILAESVALRNLLIVSGDESPATDERLRSFAEAAGIDWVPGEKWPNREDVAALYADVFEDRSWDLVTEGDWKRADEIERATGWNRVEFLSERNKTDLASADGFSTELFSNPLNRDVELQKTLCDAVFPAYGIPLARLCFGPGAFGSANGDARAARDLIARLQGEPGGIRLRNRTALAREIAERTGIGRAQGGVLAQFSSMAVADLLASMEFWEEMGHPLSVSESDRVETVRKLIIEESVRLESIASGLRTLGTVDAATLQRLRKAIRSFPLAPDFYADRRIGLKRLENMRAVRTAFDAVPSLTRRQFTDIFSHGAEMLRRSADAYGIDAIRPFAGDLNFVRFEPDQYLKVAEWFNDTLGIAPQPPSETQFQAIGLGKFGILVRLFGEDFVYRKILGDLRENRREFSEIFSSREPVPVELRPLLVRVLANMDTRTFSAESFLSAAYLSDLMDVPAPRVTEDQFLMAMTRGIIGRMANAIPREDLERLYPSVLKMVSEKRVDFRSVVRVAMDHGLPPPPVSTAGQFLQIVPTMSELRFCTANMDAQELGQTLEKFVVELNAGAFLNVARLAVERGIPVPEVTWKQFEELAQKRQLATLDPLVPRETMSRMITEIFPKARVVGDLVWLIEFAKDRGLSRPPVSAEQFIMAVRGPAGGFRSLAEAMPDDELRECVRAGCASFDGTDYVVAATAARKRGLPVPEITSVQFIFNLMRKRLPSLLPIVPKEVIAQNVRRSWPVLRDDSVVYLGTFARDIGLEVPEVTDEQFLSVANNRVGLLPQIAGLVSDAVLADRIASNSWLVDGVAYVAFARMAKERGLPVPEIKSHQFEMAVLADLGDEMFGILGAEEFSRNLRLTNGLGVNNLDYFLRSADLAVKHGVAIPWITDPLFTDAVNRSMLSRLLPVVPRETMEKGCATWPAGENLTAYLDRVAFSKANGFSYPEMTVGLFRVAVDARRVPDVFSAADPATLSRLVAVVPFDRFSVADMRTLVADHMPVLREMLALDRVAHERGIVGFLVRLSQIQPPSKNLEHDAWSTQLPKLIFGTKMTNAESVEALLDYVQTFGMIATNELRNTHALLFLMKMVASVPASDRAELEAVGVTFPSDAELARRPELSTRGLIRQLKENIGAIPERLLRGEQIGWLGSRLGQEMFRALLGETRWGNGDSVDDLQRIVEETAREYPETAAVPSAFQETRLSIRESRRTVDASSTDRLNTFLESREVAERFGALARGWFFGPGNPLPVIRTSAMVELESLRDDLRVSLLEEDERFAEATKDMAEERLAIAMKRRATAATERGRIGLERQAEKIGAAIDRLADAETGTRQGLIEWFAGAGSMLASATESLRTVSAGQMFSLMPEQMFDQVMEAIEKRDHPTLDAVDKLASVHRQYVREHYLNAEQNPEHTGHPPYSRTAVRALEKAWHLGESRAGRLPIEDLFDKGTRIMTGKELTEEDLLPVRMIPVTGLLRVYAGEIGDACYSSLHAELANGTYPKLNAWLFATEDDKDRLTLRGSVLALNLTTTDGIPTLVVRANNPKENFVRGLDAASFVRATLLEGVATARRQWAERRKAGIRLPQIVSIPFDAATASCTNRYTVANDYHRRFSSSPKLAFKDSPEATFKYDLRNPNGGHPCVEIWRVDADGKETWTGDWK